MREIPFARPYIGDAEKSAVADVLDGHVFVHGHRTTNFEDKFAQWCGSNKSVAVSSCTAGLHLAYFHLGIGPGDEVIVPAMTHVATAHAVEYMGAKPIFVDAEPDTGNIDLSQIESKITERTKALSVVHYLGMPVNMDLINKIALKYNLFVVEDAALAFGTKFKGIHAGLLGDLGVFSMYPVKHITTLEGGMILSKHKDVLNTVSSQRAFGVDRTHSERKIPGDYDVNILGFNYRMNELQAAIGICQVDRLNNFLEIRKNNYDLLTQLLSDVDEIHHFLTTNSVYESSYYCKSFVLRNGLENKRAYIIEALKEQGIGTSIYYPKPVPELSYYAQKYNFQLGAFPEAAKIAYHSIALPVGPHLKVGDIEYIALTFKQIISKLI